MKKLYASILIISLLSCNDNLLKKPDNLIPEDKMVEVLTDLAIVNAAKITNVALLQEHDIEPMAYIFEKHGIDSLQFVESDRYYASLPIAYEKIYKKVESKLEEQTKVLEEEKKVTDSLRISELENKDGKTNLDKVKDSLP
ncbi:protein of unknown function [Pricia antarctica]|uniref:DUF4296 domain-containing protein n=1 Tax=Pricia antarctica TaxID=641691 RepID=A0A1G6Y654_9FLAO|nr:DUF4296 domain-containing protein [Pricia antarctica]SDD85187.1 protein of unknown function [Pricia antarctica]